MQSQNVAEYKAIREELARVRECITHYVSFVVIGSGPAFWFLAGRMPERQSSLAMGFAALLLGILSTLVLFLLSYKFTSCNRYAGYCKLLAHERLAEKPGADEDIFLWEICVDRLRTSDCDNKKFQDVLAYCESNKSYIPSIPDLKRLIERYSGPAPEKDAWFWLRGWRLMFSGARDRGGSWKLPLYIARIFGAISLAFVVFGLVLSLRSLRNWDLRLEHYAFAVLLLTLLGMWAVFVAKLYRQMRGSETVEAFCRKFVPVRVQLLRELNDAVGYSLIGVSLSPEDEAGEPETSPLRSRHAAQF